MLVLSKSVAQFLVLVVVVQALHRHGIVKVLNQICQPDGGVKKCLIFAHDYFFPLPLQYLFSEEKLLLLGIDLPTTLPVGTLLHTSR